MQCSLDFKDNLEGFKVETQLCGRERLSISLILSLEKLDKAMRNY